MTVTLEWYLGLAAILFVIGVAGVLTRRNTLIIFMSISLVMTAIVKVLESRFSRWRPEIVKTF